MGNYSIKVPSMKHRDARTSLMSGLRAVSLRPNEIVVGAVSVTLDAARAFDPETAPRGIGIAGIDGVVRLREKGKRAVWTPLRPLPPGRYRFVVGELASRSGARLSTGTVLPFSVVQSRLAFRPRSPSRAWSGSASRNWAPVACPGTRRPRVGIWS
jgi:hypothetical protein